MKNVFSIILCLCLAVSLMSVTAFAADFNDTDGHWAENAIDRWSDVGIIEGYAGNFDPNGTMTRAQAAALFARLLKLDATADLSAYTDVAADAWYADAIAKCVAAGLMNGMGDGMMDPDGTLTREQMMVMLCRALGIDPEAECDKEFTDGDQISSWAVGYINALVNAGIVSGITEDTMAPSTDINRASMMALLDKSIAVYANEDGKTISAVEGTGVILIVADDVTVKNAPVGTIIVTGEDASGAKVNGTAVSKDTVTEVEENKPAAPSGGSSSGGGSSHSHSYTYVSLYNGKHNKTCCGTVEEACSYEAGVCKYCGYVENAVAKVGTKTYADLADAIAADGEVVLLKDVTLAQALVAPGETIDLNGKALTGDVVGTVKMNGGSFTTSKYPMVGPEGAYPYLSTNGVFTMTQNLQNVDLTFVSGSVTLNANWRTDTNQTVTVNAGATLVIPEGITFTIQTGTAAVVIDGTVTVNGSVVMEAGTTLKAAADLPVVGDTDVDVVYVDGVYTATNAAGKEARIGIDYYATLADAITAAKAGDTVTLLKDVAASEIIVINKAITLDGNGKTLNSTAGRAINVSGADGATVKNLTVVCSGERAFNIIQNATNVTIDNVTATSANYTVNVASSAPGAVVTIKNSTLNGLCTVNVAAENADVSIVNSTVNCNDNNTTAGESYAALALGKEAEGGKIIATGCTINVADGSDSVKGRNTTATGTVSINGSTADVLTQVAAIIYPGPYYHSFATLDAAIAFAKEGDTIVLLRDIDLTAYVNINKGLTLDLNGKKIARPSNGDNAVALYVNAGEGKTVTLTGNGTVSGDVAVWVQSGTAVIENGIYTGDKSPAIYTKGTGHVVINGGTFSTGYNESSFGAPCYPCLNQHDGSRADTSIVVKGGTFVKFNPAECYSESYPTNFVADGYESVQDGENWTVSAKSAQ